MTLQQFITGEQSVSLDRDTFNSANWLSYFIGNQQVRNDFVVADKLDLATDLSKPLIKSWQRFQIGESGEGKHLLKYAAATNDNVYQQCIALFIKEEQGHALLLSQTIKAAGGTLLQGHWSAALFTAIRRMLGLKTEIFILLIAEIIGKCFYKTCADHLDNKKAKDIFALIVMDEIFHLEFHSSFMRTTMKRHSAVLRQTVYYLWTALFFAASLVFILDHHSALKALKVSPHAFFKDCRDTFKRAAVRILV